MRAVLGRCAYATRARKSGAAWLKTAAFSSAGNLGTKRGPNSASGIDADPFQTIDFAEIDLRTRYRILCGAILPRPIAWISTVDSEGVNNVAPLSFFMPVTSDPPSLAFSLTTKKDGSLKDTLQNLKSNRQFVVNHVTSECFMAMYETSKEFDPTVDEFGMAKLTPIASKLVAPSRIAEAPIHMECELIDTMPVGNIKNYGSSTLVVGRVLVTHVQDKYLEERSDGAKAVRTQDMETVARLGGLEYGTIGNRWTLEQDTNW
eukprot:CAMPEP_0170198898 /NCGR_PEP_ID=MMETSP0040_2-20121228/69042_1 /TAXON_ID=641309 /ORGANISM="Lotharella oceanica, Strain CCMP622" /LENGTH=260 /DNA_ID=CAMNT_0010448963 /DNA_START=598 /DNA_END=1377 /DNA_ORIENTATION=+